MTVALFALPSAAARADGPITAALSAPSSPFIPPNLVIWKIWKFGYASLSLT